MRGVYALIDKSLIKSNKLSLEEVAKYLQKHSIKIAQYRNKSPKNKDEIIDDLKVIKSIFNGRLIINDYIEFIDLVDGIHLGQDDLRAVDSDFKRAVEVIRREVGQKILGLSTHNLEEILEANSLNLDYIGLGAYRATNTKEQVTISGDRLLEYAKSSIHPVAIIGGVRLDDKFDEHISMRVIGSDIIRAVKGQNG